MKVPTFLNTHILKYLLVVCALGQSSSQRKKSNQKSEKRLNGAPPNATARPEHLTAKAVATKPHPHPQNPVLKLEQPAHVHMSEKHRT